jgi:serine/threonine protein kinase
MALAPGTRLGTYEVVNAIGAGGMGEVYRARDTKLGRDVAIKVLPSSVTCDPERLARFAREAQVLASLNHPNIAAIYHVEEADGVPAIVMELVEGETLADRIARGPIPIDEALPIAKQIAEALEAAHEQGIIHRDLKPANIKIRSDGTVKVLDFGLAKLAEPSAASGTNPSPLSLSPTITSPALMTGVGVLLGTAAYMAPEQARGKPVDRRADIWAFGCVLYEMVTGTRAFEGEEASDTLAAILRGEPDWSRIPANVHRLLRACLDKDRKKRLQAIGDYRLLLDEATVAPRKAVAIRERLVWAAGGVIIATIATAGVTLYLRPVSVVVPETRLQISTPRDAALINFAISPDGRKVVFQAPISGRNQLWLRTLESETAQPLTGTEDGNRPFWSPDSNSIGFFTPGQLKRLDLAGGAVRTLAPSTGPFGGTWNRDGVIVFGTSQAAPLMRVSAAGGGLVQATHLDAPRQTGHRFPDFLPDGRHFLFFALGTPDSRGVYVGSLDSTETRRVLQADSRAMFAPPNYLLYAQRGVPVAEPFDLETLEPSGDPVPLARDVALDIGTFGTVAMSASAAGPIIFRLSAGKRLFAWHDRSGVQLGTLGESDAGQPSIDGLSPDGQTITVSRTIDGNTDVWLMDVVRGVRRRLTTDTTIEWIGQWSPDGNRIVFSSSRNGVLDLFQKAVNGSEGDTLLLASPEPKNATDWSPDGRYILYSSQSPRTNFDLWALPLFGDRKPFPVVQTPFAENSGRFSPDNRWITYQSSESGRDEIYIQAFPGGENRLQVTTAGGANPRWRRDGRELFYLAPNNRLMAVPVALGPTIKAGQPAALFAVPSNANYNLSADGQRFLINMPAEDPSPLTVIFNWSGSLRK